MGDIVKNNGVSITDSSGKAQAGYLLKISDKKAVLDYLAVAPWHLEKDGAKGWGSAAFYEVAKKSLELGANDLTLVSATKQSNDFYDGIGMKKTGKMREEDQSYAIDKAGLEKYISEYENKWK